MAKISDVEIARYARAAGFKLGAPIRGGAPGGGDIPGSDGGGELVVMIAVALAESRGDTHAFNDKGRDLSYGLWQINMLGNLGPFRREKYGLSSNEQLFDPATNARVARGVYTSEGSQGVRHWSVWNSRAYAFYMTRARAAARDAGEDVPEGDPGWEDIPGGEQVEDGINGIVDAVKGIADFFSWISDGKNWVRVGLFLGGGMLLLGGLIFAFGREVDVKQAANLIPAGRALKKAAGK